jgi:hypothetical protein
MDGPMSRSELNVLVLSDFDGASANVIRDFLYSFNRHSRHRFYYMHSWTGNNFGRLLNFDFNRFDAIVLFWDFLWIGADSPLNPSYVPPWISERIASSSALKIQFLQDEYRDVRLANRVMARFGVNVICTCVAPKDHELFYPKKLIPSLEAIYPVLTGYVPTYLENVHCPASTDRPIDIGYRSRKLAYYLGTLGQEKSIIAERFQEIADAHGFRADISVRESDRIYGNDWLAFMRSCRFSLGTESGASVVDFDGSIRTNCQEYLRDHPDASFDEVKNLFFGDVDGKVCVQTISPRIFETSAFENTLVLHEGHYEGMLEPDIDYIPVKKDYSNVAEIVAKMRDRAFCIDLARSAKEKLILSKRYNYASFVRQFDALLERHVPAKRRVKETSRTVFYFLNYLNNDALVPCRDAVLHVPHPLDLTGNKTANVAGLFYSCLALTRLVAQAPATRALLVRLIRKQIACADISLVDFVRDLRILAMLRLHRRDKKRVPVLPFEVQMLGVSGQGLVVRSVNVLRDGFGTGGEYDPRILADQKKLLDQALTGAEDAPLIWDHHLVGDTLLLLMTGTRRCDVFLNAEGIWRFEAFNRVLRECDADERRAVLTEILFPGNASVPARGTALVTLQLIGTVMRFLMSKPINALAPLLKGARRRDEVAANQR